MKSTKVVVIGTEHDLHYEDPKFSLKILVELIQKTNPDIICAELSSEQLEGTQTCKSKPEYPDAIIPFAQKNSIPVIPIQPCTSEGIEWGNRQRIEKARIQSTPGLKEKWDFWLLLSDSCEEVDSPTLHAMQSRAYDTWSEIIFERLQSKLFPELWKLKEEWNSRFYLNILKTIHDNSGSRIAITVGFKHKHWLNNRLGNIPNVTLEHIEDYIDTKKCSVNN